MKRLPAAAILLGLAHVPALADSANETTLKSIPDRATFNRVVFDTIKKAAALNDPDAIWTTCNDGQGDHFIAYCETIYSLDGPDKLEVVVDVGLDGKVDKNLCVYQHNIGSLYLYPNGSLSYYDSKTKHNQPIRDGWPSGD
jgi:hypothetical protein